MMEMENMMLPLNVVNFPAKMILDAYFARLMQTCHMTTYPNFTYCFNVPLLAHKICIFVCHSPSWVLIVMPIARHSDLAGSCVFHKAIL